MGNQLRGEGDMKIRIKPIIYCCDEIEDMTKTRYFIIDRKAQEVLLKFGKEVYRIDFCPFCGAKLEFFD